VLPDDINARISRRAALRLGVGAGALAVAAPYLPRVLGHGGAAVDLDGADLAMVRRPNWPAPPIITRAQWGANEALRKPGQIYDAAIHKLIVHHTGTPNDVTNYAGLCRGIMQNEVAGEYIDIAYNWLIDPLGRIYEGRWATNYPAGAVHTGELNGNNVRGGHALNYNTQTVGIALMGNYELIQPSTAMMNALVTLLTWKCARWGLDPLGFDWYVNGNGVLVKNLPNICGHRDTIATACPGSNVEAQLPTVRRRVAARFANSGYWVAASDGQVVPFGGAPDAGDTVRLSIHSPIIDIAAHPSGLGYWTLGADGGVFTFGNARFFGSTGGMRLTRPVVGMAPTPSGNGYWLVASDGGIFSFGDARFYGSTGGLRLNAPVLGMARTATGKGYWLYARDGGIFTYGDAKFLGSTGAIRLARPIVGMAARPQGDGYWLVTSDGGVFTFGRAPFRGSAFGRMSAPCVGMAASSTGNGYVLLGADGSVWSYGDAPYLGGARGQIFGSAVGIAGRINPL
jgi:N-acetylmuramoyl-L-alanine amidase-like protein